MFMTLEEKREIVAAGGGDKLPPYEGPRFHTTGGHSHQIAANVIQEANQGTPLLIALKRFCDPDSPTEGHRPSNVLHFIHGLDESADVELKVAISMCSSH